MNQAAYKFSVTNCPFLYLKTHFHILGPNYNLITVRICTARVLIYTKNFTAVNHTPSARNVPSLTNSRISTQGRVARHAQITLSDAVSTPFLAAGRNHTERQRTEAACPTGAVRVRGAGGSIGPIPASLAR